MGRLHRFGVATASLAAVSVALALVLSVLPAWPFVLVEHFRVQIVVGAFVVAVATAALRVRGYFDVALVALVIHALWLVPDLTQQRRPIPDGDHVRVLLLNVHTSSSAFDKVRALIDDVKPDIIGLVEIDQRWLDGIAPSVAGYQRLEHPRGDNFGLALYSKFPLTAHVEEFRDLPSAFAEVTLPSGPLHIILTHPIPPVSAPALRDQVGVFDALTTKLEARTIVMGDFNATPWSRPFQHFIGATGLCDSRAGFGLQASFPAYAPLLRIPIDHMLVSCAIGIVDRRIERDVGSDHLPVVVELVMPYEINER